MKTKERFGVLIFTVAVVAGCSQVSPKAAVPNIDGSAAASPTPTEKVRNTPERAVFNQQVDILLVVDDSGSMANHQGNLSKNIKLFTAELAKTQFLDYHVGVVTTSMDKADPKRSPWGSAECDDPNGVTDRACGDGKLVRYKTNVPFIDRYTPNGLRILETNVLVGTGGSGEEKSFDPIQAALTAPLANNENKGFLRSNASLAIIFVTDAEDQSQMSPQNLYDALVKLKNGQAEKVMAYGALVPSNVQNPSCSRDDGTTTPQKIEEFIALAKGLEYNICDSNYGTKLATIAKDVIAKVGRVMYLSRPPVVDTIKVTYGTQVILNSSDEGWTYDPVRNALVFGEKLKYTIQPQGTQLEVNFDAGSY